MLVRVSVTIRDYCPPPPSPARLGPDTGERRIKTACTLCTEGYLFSLYTSQNTSCPICKGKGFTIRIEKPQTALAGALTRLRAAGVLNPAIPIALTLTIALGLSCNMVFEAFKALLAYLY